MSWAESKREFKNLWSRDRVTGRAIQTCLALSVQGRNANPDGASRGSAPGLVRLAALALTARVQTARRLHPDSAPMRAPAGSIRAHPSGPRTTSTSALAAAEGGVYKLFYPDRKGVR